MTVCEHAVCLPTATAAQRTRRHVNALLRSMNSLELRLASTTCGENGNPNRRVSDASLESVHMHMHMHTHTHARTHARTRTHTCAS
jgi:hypothetical protein